MHITGGEEIGAAVLGILSVLLWPLFRRSGDE